MVEPKYLEMEGQIKRETEKALLISFFNGREEWIPKSTVNSEFTSNYTITQKFLIAKWIVKKNTMQQNSNRLELLLSFLVFLGYPIHVHY